MGRSRCGSMVIILATSCMAMLLTDNRYLFNPFTIAACLGRSTSAFTSTAILYALSNAVTGNSFNAMLALGCASYLSIYPALLFIPLVLLCYDRRAQVAKPSSGVAIFAIQHFGILLLGVGGLLSLSYLVVPDFQQFISATYGFQLLVPDLTPNIGLWWYFFIEIFESFREFFLGVFWLHLTGYVGGLTVRLRKQPLFVLTSLVGIFTIFKPYPSISDASLYFALLPLYRHLFPCKFCECPWELALLTTNSDALHLFCHFGASIRHSPGPCILLLMDLRWIWQCQFLLCDHTSVESGTFHTLGRHNLRCS